MQYDVFNGDADGICALHQLRLDQPKPEAHLVTGVKRDIKLLGQLTQRVKAGDAVTVLDISLDSNREDLTAILATGCTVFYADHHFCGEIPGDANLTAHIDPNAHVCTSLIVDKLLCGKYRAWAVAAAFGDNLHDSALNAAKELKASEESIAILRELGELLNYNGYGAAVDDLHFSPQDLFRSLQPFSDPLDFYYNSDVLAKLRQGFKSDMESSRARDPYFQNDTGRIFLFPAQPWGKRAAGVFSNEKAREMPNLAHALLVDNGDDTFLISVRAPLHNRQGADQLCRSFPTGGGRAAAAGINALPSSMLDQFIEKFNEVFSK